ncbi:MAG: cyclodeaminase/cyclohydrolase family protein [bacterium]|nr:cyclodeaminase/cyclohydrolase family protein [bacterium]
MFSKQTIAEYFDDLASANPTPGGGVVTAITGAQGVALLAMVCNLTLGKQKFTKVDEEIRLILVNLETNRRNLLNLAEQDAASFKAVIVARRLPKENSIETEIRAKAIQEALKASSEVPFAVFKICLKVLLVAERLGKICNPSVISDVEVGRYLLLACLLGSKVNVVVNLDGITDVGFCKEKRDYILGALQQIRAASGVNSFI